MNCQLPTPRRPSNVGRRPMLTGNGAMGQRPLQRPRPWQNATPAKPGTGAHRPRGRKPLPHNQQESTRRYPTQHSTLLPGAAAREAYVTHPERHSRCPPVTTFWSRLEEAGEQVSAHCCLCRPVVETERRRAEGGFPGLGVAPGLSGGSRAWGAPGLGSFHFQTRKQFLLMLI